MTAIAGTGDLDRADRLAADAETARPHHHRPRHPGRGRSPSWSPRSRRRVTWTSAEALARTITDPDAQAWALSRAGYRDRRRPVTWTAPPGWPPTPRPLARSIRDPIARPEHSPGWPPRSAKAGDLDRAARLAADAETARPHHHRPRRPGQGARRSWSPLSPRPGTWTAPRPSPAPSPTLAPGPGAR